MRPGFKQPSSASPFRVRDVAISIRRDLNAESNHTTPAIRHISRKYSRYLADQSPANVVRIATALLRGASWPERLIAYELLSRSDVLHLVNDTMIERWAKGLADWGSIDMYGVTLAGVAWRDGAVSDKQIMQWARSADHWRRRLALVATVPLNSRARGGAGDARRTLKICRSLIDDRHDMVVKAMSWALRELAKRDPNAVAEFAKQMRPRLAPRVLREVRNKLETGLKNPRRARSTT